MISKELVYSWLRERNPAQDMNKATGGLGGLGSDAPFGPD